VYCCCVCLPCLFLCLVEKSQDLATGRLPTGLSRKQPRSVLSCSIFYKYVALSFKVTCYRMHSPFKYDLTAQTNTCTKSSQKKGCYATHAPSQFQRKLQLTPHMHAIDCTGHNKRMIGGAEITSSWSMIPREVVMTM